MTEDDGRQRRGFIVRGRVQGVGFRWSTTQAAQRLGLRGTVRNRADGTVEVHVEGPARRVHQLEKWLHEGPRTARVEEVEEVPPDDDLPDGFRIVR